MWNLLYKITTAGLKDLPRKGRDGARERNFGFPERSIVSFRESSRWCARKELWISAKRLFCYEGNIGQRPYIYMYIYIDVHIYIYTHPYYGNFN